MRTPQSSAQLAPLQGRFSGIVDALDQAGLSSSTTKYVVYYDGPTADANVCGQGGSDSSGFGAAVVYYRACVGVSTAAVTAHEVLHTFGAVSSAAPNECDGESSGHTCDDESDLMFPSIGGEPLSSKLLDPGRDDYYGHAGGWTDTQDSAWLVRLDSQAPLALTVSGPGSVSADVPGLLCAASCTTTWNAGQRLALTATPSAGARLVRWSGACSGAAGCVLSVTPGAAVIGGVRARVLPAVGRSHRKGSRAELAGGDHVSAALLGGVPVVQPRAADGDGGEGLEVPLVERRLPRREEDLHGADERGHERPRHVRSRLNLQPRTARIDQVASFAVDAVHDVVVVGAGCAGMRAAIEAFDAGANVAMVSKIHPVRSHSGAAEGGINAALGNASEDDPEKHAFDTVKGSDYLGDQDAIEILCREAPDDVYQLEHWGAVFSRTRGRPHRAAPVRRRRRAENGVRSRHHGPRPDPRPLRAGHEARHPDVRGVLRVEARHRRRTLPGRDRLGPPPTAVSRRSARRR